MAIKTRLDEEAILRRIDKSLGLIKKDALTTSDFSSGGGILPAEKSANFIRKLLDASVLLDRVTVKIMTGPQAQLNKIGVGSRVTHGHTEATANSTDWESKPTFSKVDMATTIYLSEFSLSYESLEDNLERDQLEETIISQFSEQMAADLEEAALIGDTTKVLADCDSAEQYRLLIVNDGWYTIANDDDDTHILDWSSKTVDAELFYQLKRIMPEKYRRNYNDLVFLVSPDVEDSYRYWWTARETSIGDEYLLGDSGMKAWGIPLVRVPLIPSSWGDNENESFIILTRLANLYFGIQSEIRLERDRDIHAQTFEFVIRTRCDFAIEECDAVSVAKSVKKIDLT